MIRGELETGEIKFNVSYPVREVYRSFVANVLVKFSAIGMDERESACTCIYFSEEN